MFCVFIVSFCQMISYKSHLLIDLKAFRSSEENLTKWCDDGKRVQDHRDARCSSQSATARDNAWPGYWPPAKVASGVSQNSPGPVLAPPATHAQCYLLAMISSLQLTFREGEPRSHKSDSSPPGACGPVIKHHLIIQPGGGRHNQWHSGKLHSRNSYAQLRAHDHHKMLLNKIETKAWLQQTSRSK